MKAVLVLETVHVSALNRRVKCRALCVGPLSAWTGRSTARSMATLGARIRARRPRRAAAAVSLRLQALYSVPAPRAVLPLGTQTSLQVPNDCRSTAHRCLPFAHRCDAICTHCVRALASVYTSKLPRGLLTKTLDRCSKPDRRMAGPCRQCAHFGQAPCCPFCMAAGAGKEL